MKIKEVRPTFRARIQDIADGQAMIDQGRIVFSWRNRLINWIRPGYTAKKLAAYNKKTAASVAALTKRVSHGAVEGK